MYNENQQNSACFFLFVQKNQRIDINPTPTEAVACTMEARICPDGTSVGRVPPDCEFAPCTYPNAEKQRCGEVTGYKPCPKGYACRLETGMNGTCEKCPEVEYVDCMPGPDNYNSQCSQEYLSWATSNCPGFKGAAY